MKKSDAKRVFVIINSYRVGDILLTNSLIQNIKRIYKDSHVVMLTSPSLVDVAKYQEGVDDVVIWDRHGKHHGLLNTLKFVWNFPYKKIYAAIPIYGMDRPVVLSKLLGAKYIICSRRSAYTSIFRKSKYKYEIDYSNMQKTNASLLAGITKEEICDYPIIYNAFPCAERFIPKDKYLVVCPTSSRKEKDMPYQDIVETIKQIKDYKVILLGRGKEADIISEKIKRENLENIIDLTDKTSIVEMADIMKNSEAVITVDTGTLHLSCALQKPTVALFYTKGVEAFMPNPDLYNCVVLENNTVENIITNLNKLLG